MGDAVEAKLHDLLLRKTEFTPIPGTFALRSGVCARHASSPWWSCAAWAAVQQQVPARRRWGFCFRSWSLPKYRLSGCYHQECLEGSASCDVPAGFTKNRGGKREN